VAPRVSRRGQQGLKRRGLDPEERELRRLQAKIGDMTMRLELAEHLLEKRGVRGGCAEAAEMSRRRSSILGKRYPLRTVCEVWYVPRSTVYAGRTAAADQVGGRSAGRRPCRVMPSW
jgi:hypothetical protein